MPYDLNVVASLYKKVISGKTYWYLREMGWVDGKPKMVSERYLGTAAEIAALLEAREAAVLPERTRHLAFGDVAAAWGMLDELGVAAVIDEAAGAAAGRAAAVHRDLPGAGGAEPAGRPVLEARVRGLVEDHRGGPVHQDRRPGAGSPPVLGRDARCHPGAAARGLPADRGADRAGLGGWTCRAVALDMTNFATFIATANGKAPIAQRGQGQAEAL